MTGPRTRKYLTGASLILAAPLTRAQEITADPVVANPFGTEMITMPLLIVAVIGLVLFFRNQREKRRYELFSQCVEQGREIPRELLPLLQTRERDFARGVWLLCIGLGVGLVLYIATTDWQVAAWALILLFLSAASFINGLFFSGQPGSDSRSGNAG